MPVSLEMCSGQRPNVQKKTFGSKGTRGYEMLVYRRLGLSEARVHMILDFQVFSTGIGSLCSAEILC